MREDIDLAYRCYHCGKLVLKADIIYSPHGCPKCGGSKLQPIELSWFGVYWCKFWNWLKTKKGENNGCEEIN